jgi:hypothetical protein
MLIPSWNATIRLRLLNIAGRIITALSRRPAQPGGIGVPERVHFTEF